MKATTAIVLFRSKWPLRLCLRKLRILKTWWVPSFSCFFWRICHSTAGWWNFSFSILTYQQRQCEQGGMYVGWAGWLWIVTTTNHVQNEQDLETQTSGVDKLLISRKTKDQGRKAHKSLLLCRVRDENVGTTIQIAYKSESPGPYNLRGHGAQAATSFDKSR